MTAREDSLNVLLSATAEVVDDFVDEVTVLRDEVLQLRVAMEERAPIEQARGMLMMRYGLSADTALRLLLRWSRTQEAEPWVFAAVLVNLGIDEGHAANHRQITSTSPGSGRWPGPGQAVGTLNLGSADTSGG